MCVYIYIYTFIYIYIYVGIQCPVINEGFQRGNDSLFASQGLEMVGKYLEIEAKRKVGGLLNSSPGLWLLTALHEAYLGVHFG